MLIRRLYPLVVLISAAPASGAVHDVIVRNVEFDPPNITVTQGDSVHFIWESGNHTITSGDSCTYDGLYFDEPSTAAEPDFIWEVPTDVEGEIPYYCRPHCFSLMEGTITVMPAGEMIEFLITLDGVQQSPIVDTTGAGSGMATLDLGTNLFSWDITFSDLAGVQTGAHIHGAAGLCETAGVQIGLGAGSPIVGSSTLAPEQAEDVLAGLWYVNIHTDLFPAGEIRGQIMPTPLTNPIEPSIEAGGIHIQLEPIATGLVAPNWGAPAPGIDGRLYVSDQAGILWNIDIETGAKSVFLDASTLLVDLGVFGPDTFDERGLLGVAFHPDYAANGLLYTYTSEPVDGEADFSTMPIDEMADHQAAIREWTVGDPSDPDAIVDAGSSRVLLRVDEPQFNHDGGAVNFGPDGMLYVSFGDGGGADDQDGQGFIDTTIIGHSCLGNGFDNGNVLGTILRIDPDGMDSANGEYGIPGDNPFVGKAGIDEIFAYGFRNPFRFSFDSMTGELYAGDVGQGAIEEIDIVTSGGNYGWRDMEGSFFFVPNGASAGYITDMPLSVASGLIGPIAEYDHDEGTAVIGGFVYRGGKIPAMAGSYVFGDWSVTFQGNDGRLFHLVDGGNMSSSEIREFQFVGQPALDMSLSGFGQDGDGELYVLANTTGTPFGDTGVVLKIRTKPGDVDANGFVDVLDLLELLAAWGACDGCPEDIDDNGVVDVLDLLTLLANWG